MTDYASSHFIHLCRFIPTLEWHLPYTAHWPRSETGVSNSNTTVSSVWVFLLSTGSLLLWVWIDRKHCPGNSRERIRISWEKDKLQCLNLEVRSENEVRFLAARAGKICYSSASIQVVTRYRSACGNSRLYRATLWEVFLVGTPQLGRVFFYLRALSWAQTFAREKAWELDYFEPVVKGLWERVTWDCQWLHLCYPWLPVRRVCPENCLGCMQESI